MDAFIKHLKKKIKNGTQISRELYLFSVLPWSVIAERRRIIGTVCSYMSLRGR